MTKRNLCNRLVCLLLCLLLMGYSGRASSLPGGSEKDAQQVYADTEKGFSFLYGDGMSAERDSGAVTVYTEGDGNAPYVKLFFTSKGEVLFDLADYLYFAGEDLRSEYGDDVLEVGETQSFDVAGRTLTGIRCILSKPQESAYRWFLADENDTYVVQYECVCEKDDESSVVDTLEHLVDTLRPDANYYNDASKTDDGGNNQSVPATLGSYAVQKSTPLTLQTSLYDGGFFSLQLPAGWVIETTGAYTLFGFHAWDPNCPERQLFFYCKHHPLLKSMEAQQYFEMEANMVGGTYRQSADTPVLLEPTTDYFFYIYNDYNYFLNKYGLNHQLPVMNDISILEKYPNSTPTAPNTLDNSIVRASFYSANGVECEGLMAGQVVDYGTDVYSVPGIDMGSYAVFNCNGVIAPAGEFNELREQLTACLASFTFTDEYVRQAQDQGEKETSAILAMSRRMQAACDSYNSAWSARQTSYDILSQKNSDATLGYDRLYDPDTGEIYRAELGFYDSYDTNRGQYGNPDLQLIEDSTENYYLDDVDYYITK